MPFLIRSWQIHTGTSVELILPNERGCSIKKSACSIEKMRLSVKSLDSA